MMRLIKLIFIIVMILMTTGTVLVEAEVMSLPDLVGEELVLEGTEVRLLPANIDIWSMDWSPDGKAIIYSGKLQGEHASKMRIWYWSLDPASNPVQLTNTEGLVDNSPRWSPDGKLVALTRRSLGDRSNATSAIWLKEMSEGVGKQLSSGPHDRDASWSPDGQELVFVRMQGSYRSQLVIVNLASGVTRILAGAEGELYQSPWWGKDGRIYFTKLTPGLNEVVVEGQTYQTMELGQGSIWSIEADGENLTAVISDEFDNRMSAVSPDGSRMAFISSRCQSEEGNGKFDRGSLYIKDLKTGLVTYITNKVSMNGGSLAWNPQGDILGFFTFRSIRPAIWVIKIP